MQLFERILKFLTLQRKAEKAVLRERPAAPLRSMADVQALLEAAACLPASALVHRAARACFHILPADDGNHAQLGCSRLGGAPDLAIGTCWPTAEDGRLLTFYGQINLADIAIDATAPLLPAHGLLSFFSGAIESSLHSVGAQAVFTPPGAPLQRLAPGRSGTFADDRVSCLDPVRVRFDAGLSFPVEQIEFLRKLEAAAPTADIDAVMAGLAAAPSQAIGQLLGYAQFHSADVHSAIYFEEIKRANQDRLEIWESWDAWEAAKLMQSRLNNGQIYRPWSAADDDNVRWILANKAVIAAGIEQWHSLLWISSNPLMKLWINDADPIFFLAKMGESGQLDLSRARAGATQS